MSNIHVQRLRTELEKRFKTLIDMSDCITRAQPDQEVAFLSRALAAWAIVTRSSASNADAAQSITDGFDDSGIDAVYFDEEAKKLFVCQAKWSVTGVGSIDQAGIQKFLAGVNRLMSLKFAHFNKRLMQQKAVVENALLKTDTCVQLVLTHTGVDRLGDAGKRDLDEFLEENNDTADTFTSLVLGQADNYNALVEANEGKSVNLTITLREWGCHKEPYNAFYGQASAREVAAWWRTSGLDLLAKNIRSFKGSTEVNAGIAETLQKNPSDFWYLNNGITILCGSVKKQVLGGADRDIGQFVCTSASVVNGAQTVGQIGSCFATEHAIPADAKVLVRLISLEGAPAGFAQRVTRATNTQNRVEGRDFASLDENQRRIHREMVLDGFEYVYRSGDGLKTPATGCTLQEAAVALACAEIDIAPSVLVKNQVGRLFDDIGTPPYTTIFNASTTGRDVWLAVRVMRCVDTEIDKLANKPHPKAKLLAAHANRFILHMVFQDIALRGWRGADLQARSLELNACATAQRVFVDLATHLNSNEPNIYPQPYFKTLERCRILVGKLTGPANITAAPPMPVPEAPANTDRQEPIEADMLPFDRGTKPPE